MSPRQLVLAALIIASALVVVAVVPSGSDQSGTGVASPSLADAAATGDVSLARELLAAGRDPDGPRVLGFTPLMRAAIRDDAAMTQLLIEWDADLAITTPGGLTAWHIAAEADSAAALQEFIDAGVDIDTRSRSGMNTLQHAAAANSPAALRVIARAGADLDEASLVVTQGHGFPADIGSTALGIAARAGNEQAISALLDLGAEVDARSTRGNTALLVAIVAGQRASVVALLLDAEADPLVTMACVTRCNLADGDALVWARRRGDPAVIDLVELAVAAQANEGRDAD